MVPRGDAGAARFYAASPNPTFNTLMDRADSAAEISDAAQQRDENF
jgi:hypothetical protein